MENLDPLQIEKLEKLRLKRIRKDKLRIYLLNILLIIMTMGCLSRILLTHIVPGTLEKILFPIFISLFPIVISQFYPPHQRDELQVFTRPILTLRLNITGAVFLSVVLNVAFHAAYGWLACAVLSLVFSYILAFIIPIRPAFGDYISPPVSWTKLEFISKTVLICVVSMISGFLWNGLFPQQEQLFNVRQEYFPYIYLLGLTTLIPFYFGLFVVNIPVTVTTKSSGHNADELENRFKR